MDATRRSPPADGNAPLHALSAAVVRSIARALPDGGRAAVALSGGRDSVALLDAALAGAAAARSSIVALHVDHGLSPHAAAWAQFCRELCAARDVRCVTATVSVQRRPRISVEAAARTARYSALARLAEQHGAGAVLLAHHADDQAETTLLQLVRGAGPPGLAGMPAARFDGTLWWLRPWLDVPRARIDDYVALRGLRHVDDESNDRHRFRRNALRHSVLPALRALAPGYPATLVRAAGLQADAAALLDDLARLDAREACDGATLDCAVFTPLDDRRAANVLRWFLRQHRLPAPSQARLAETVRQLRGVDDASRIEIQHGGAVLGVHRRRLVVHRPPAAPFACAWNGTEPIQLVHGTLTLFAQTGAGIAACHVARGKVTIRSGADGERLRIRGTRRSVADLLREADIPSWARRAVPRIYCGDALAAVTAIGPDEGFAAAAGEAGYAWRWAPAPDLRTPDAVPPAARR